MGRKHKKIHLYLLGEELDQEQFHILSITPNQQAALRYCVLNWVQQKTLLYINALKNKPTDEKFAIASESISESLMLYDELAGIWPVVTEHSLRGPTKLFYFDPKHFRALRQALNLYNKSTANIVLGESRARFVDAQMGELRRLLHESSKFTYELSELNSKAGGRLK